MPKYRRCNPCAKTVVVLIATSYIVLIQDALTVQTQRIVKLSIKSKSPTYGGAT